VRVAQPSRNQGAIADLKVHEFFIHF
jgi:hypothetical protein